MSGMREKRLLWLDLIRGISALLVCANHLRAAVFQDYSSGAEGGIIEKAFYFLTGVGSEAVIIFFVLSGFLVGGGVVKRWRNFNFYEYIVARLLRLWVVLIPILFLTYLIDRVLAGICPQILSGKYIAILSSGPNSDYASDFLTLIGNIFFLQTVIFPVYGSNSPLWSLSNEFWYYIAFPVMCWVLACRMNWWIKVLLLFVSFSSALIISDKFVGFLVWLMGVAAHMMRSRFPFVKSLRWILLVLSCFCVSILANKLTLINSYLGTLGLGLSSSLLIYLLSGLEMKANHLRKFALMMSEISYSLYLLHFPLVLFIYVILFRGGQLMFGVQSFLVYVFLLGVLVLFAYMFWYLFERQTERLRVVFEGWLTFRK